ncbi:Arginine--tRNA ligase [uncultured delta proteobacterium]|uniref:Arginine--tRNA ligase n=1 Tax=uncultured delta proteobacterium TaxID=34034 RepID=A0A212J747_9DELT|nr:Arginine--tRNA ligase [uncultured delta proteobacterium]
MRAKILLSTLLQNYVASVGLPWPDKAVIEPPRDKQFGDIASNIALLLAKDMGKSPRDLAEEIAKNIKTKSTAIESVSVAGPGFVNVTLTPGFWQDTVRMVEKEQNAFGASQIGANKKIQVEYVSANPTGPLHIGHGRGAAIGDSLARVLRFAGYDVHTEYYINDAGRQMRLLGLSVWLRVQELAGNPVTWPEDWYKGDYIIDIAKEMLAQTPDLAAMPEEKGVDACFEYAMQSILDGIKEDLRIFSVGHDVWYSERSLVAKGAVEKAFERLKNAGYTYEKDGALWFRTTNLGDDKDRVLRKSDGSLTYFASDIAYHDDKYNRGFEQVVDIWGADHHGYVPRMRAAVAALGREKDQFDVILVQLVNLLRNGEQIAMSTRAGEFETLADVMKEVGVDASRFMFLSRKSDSHLDFDLELVKQRSMDNPVYYVQYAHARIAAVLRKAAERGLTLPEHGGANLALLTEKAEVELLRRMDGFADVVANAAGNLAPHHISHYLMELAGDLHSYYAAHQVLGSGDDALALARLALLRAVGRVVANGLELLGVSAPDSM